jgi:hypothetical protein
MQTCTVCNSKSPDTVKTCQKCGADLTETSQTAVALARFRDNPRVGHVRVIAHADCCPACRAAEGGWPKDQVPKLPVEGCAHPLGCRCFYEPELMDVFP